MQPADWAAVLHTFAQALTASPISVTQSPPPLPRRLPVRLLDGETLVAAFMPTDEPGTVMCTLSRRGAAPLQG